jgi:hypothetical protein
MLYTFPDNLEVYAKIHDAVQLKPLAVDSQKKLFFETKDSYSPTGQSLLVRIAASHAGRLTGNHALYLPQKMQDAIASFTQPYEKPVLLNHEDDGCPIGRIKNAEYVDLSGKLTQQDKRLQNCLRPGIPFQDMVQLADYLSKRLLDPNYAGMGFAQVVAKITDPDAI